MDVQFQIQAGVGVVTVSGALTVSTVDRFRDPTVRWLAANGAVKNVVLDLGAVDNIDSTALGAILSLLKRVGDRGGDLKIARLLQPKPRLLFEITRAHKVFEIFDTAEEALRACA